MNVQLLGHESFKLRLGRAVPWRGGEVGPGRHVSCCDGVPSLVAGLARSGLIALVLALLATVVIRLVAILAALDLVVVFAASGFVAHAAPSFGPGEGAARVDAVIAAKVVEGDVSRGILHA